MNSAMDILAGKTIKNAFISKDKTLLQFITDAGSFTFNVVSDFCSTSWIEKVYNSEHLRDSIVVGVNELPLVKLNCCKCKKEVFIVQYGVVIILDGRPNFSFVYHNESSYDDSGGSLIVRKCNEYDDIMYPICV